MSQMELLNSPNSTQHLLDKLNHTIVEARLLKRLEALKNDLRALENPKRQFIRANYLKTGIVNLESDLETFRGSNNP